MSIHIYLKNFRTINTFGRDTYNGKITLKEADEDQSSLLVEIMDSKKKNKTAKSKEKTKKDVPINLYALLEGREKTFDAFESKLFPIKIEGTGFSDHSSLKILTPKQMLQKLPIVLPQVKAGNTSENLLNKIIYSLYRAKESLKKRITI